MIKILKSKDDQIIPFSEGDNYFYIYGTNDRMIYRCFLNNETKKIFSLEEMMSPTLKIYKIRVKARRMSDNKSNGSYFYFNVSNKRSDNDIMSFEELFFILYLHNKKLTIELIEEIVKEIDDPEITTYGIIDDIEAFIPKIVNRTCDLLYSKFANIPEIVSCNFAALRDSFSKETLEWLQKKY